ncbi:MAG: hypothetical protein ACREJD_15400 [Phycisphaerales bacterium]
MFTSVSTVERPESAATSLRATPIRLALLAPAPAKKQRRPLLNLDLDRRRREALSREFATRVTEHAKWLPAADLALLNWVYRSQRPLTELAATGMARQWVLHRKLNRIVARVLSPAYRHVAMVLACTKKPPQWPPAPNARITEEALQLASARAIFINGLTVRETARILGISRQRVTRYREIVALQAEALTPV